MGREEGGGRRGGGRSNTVTNLTTVISTNQFLLALAGLVLLLASSPAFAAERGRSNDCREALSDRAWSLSEAPPNAAFAIQSRSPSTAGHRLHLLRRLNAERIPVHGLLAGHRVGRRGEITEKPEDRRDRAHRHLQLSLFRGAPPPCKLSQHAHAAAIDVHEFRRKDGRGSRRRPLGHRSEAATHV